MKYQGTLIAVADMERAKHFYEMVMEQKVLMDLGVHVAFEGGLSLQSNFEELVGVELAAQAKPDNFQIYFEVEDLDCWETKLKSTEGIVFLHESKEYPWGQRVMRFYDHDQYIVEVSESMETVVRRYLKQGMSIEEAAERTMFPVEFVRMVQGKE